MGKAKKCDRCGVLYECYGEKVSDDFNFICLYFIEPDDGKWFRRSLDLCPDCMKELKDWLTPKKPVIVPRRKNKKTKPVEYDVRID